MKLEPQNKIELLKAALGEIESDLAITNVQVVNVFTGEIYPAIVYVKDGFIAHVETKQLNGPINSSNIFDGEGKTLMPGFIDAHMHIESSMMVPRNFAKAVIPHGTTTIIHDPHELANVYGIEGVTYMHDCGEDLPMRQLVDIPSCVPAVPECENAGAAFFANEIEDLASLERVVGLAEVMDYQGVIHGDDRMMDIIAAARKKGLYLQGHAPRLGGRELSAYLCGGPNTCHETTIGEEALEKLRNGMYVDARESSISKNIEAIWSGVKHIKFFDTLTLCSDDRESDDILHDGHMNAVVRKAISVGMEPVTAIKSATINTAREIGMDHLGAIAPSYVADMVLVDSIENLKALSVFYEGKLVAENGVMLAKIEDKSYEMEQRNSMKVEPLTRDDFIIHCPIENGNIKVNVMQYQDVTYGYTTAEVEELPVVNGELKLTDNLAYVAIINRYGKGTKALHIVRNFGTTHGTLASTVSHDSHNLTVLYDNADNALIAANELISIGGGMTAVEDGHILHTLRLEIGGLMSKLEAKELSLEAKKMKDAERKLGLVHMENPLLRIVTLALPVAPAVKMSDMGLVDVATKKIIPLFE